MNDHTLKVLEYRSLLDRIAFHCQSAPGRRRAMQLLPFVELGPIQESLDLISEMNEIFAFDGGPPGLAFDDLAERLERFRSSGDIFEPKELLDYASFFAIVHDFQKIRSQYRKLHELIAGLVYPQNLHTEIEATVDISGEIKDSASSELRRLRRELVEVRGKLNDKFERYLRSDTASYLSDNLYTIRDGRYVLPVRETDKGRVKGIIHDRSSSGVTFFIEPAETVDMNNRHRELETAEREEINRILRHLSEMLFANFEAICDDVAILSRLDFVAACTRLARELDSSRPNFNENSTLSILRGRHPALMLRAMDKKKEIVPLDLAITREECVLVITGPNTGGKTVALKTVGLLSLMAASGLFVPAGPKSQFILFNKIFADIGDEQSIESSLSTYSSHLNHIKEALEEANDRSLVLLDELGAGTDPEEGSAIGQAVVEHLSRTRCYSVVTTHHGKLKALAGRVPGVINGSMEFDLRNLNPTFVFQAGIPGSSYAVEIAKKLGISEKITGRAWELLDQKERDLTRLIAEINQKSVELSNELKRAAEGRLTYESLSKIYQDKLDSWQRQEKELRKKHLRESEEIIKAAKQELDRLIETARQSKGDRQAVREIRREVNERLTQARGEIEKMTSPVFGFAQAKGLPGERVMIRGIEAEGEVLEPADSSGRVRVRIGNATMLTDLEKLVALAEPGQELKTAQVKTDYAPTPGLEIDIRGLTFDEAEPVIERYLDDAGNAGLETVSIIHGKGTGMLRKKVQEYLNRNPLVSSHRLGNWNEGSSGVSVVTLRKED
jgi:DNA mismatch repair protein MutS2